MGHASSVEKRYPGPRTVSGEYAELRLGGRRVLIVPAHAVRQLSDSSLGPMEVRRGRDVLVVSGGRVRRLLWVEAVEVARAVSGSASAAGLHELLQRMRFGIIHALDEAEVAHALIDRFQLVELVDDRGRWSGPPPVPKRRELPHDPDARPLPESTWVAVTVVEEDDFGRPLAGARFRLRLPDASIVTGALDSNGHTRVDGIEPGKCWIELTDVERGKTA